LASHVLSLVGPAENKMSSSGQVSTTLRRRIAWLAHASGTGLSAHQRPSESARLGNLACPDTRTVVRAHLTSHNATLIHWRREALMSLENPYATPKAVVREIPAESMNNSGGGSEIVPPEGVRGWFWGVFLLNWIWAIGNRSYIGLLALIPYIGFIVAIYLGVKGRELAWRNKRWESLEHFNRVQRSWTMWGLIIVVGIALIGVLAAIVLPAYQEMS
jgi:hypothetical protein